MISGAIYAGFGLGMKGGLINGEKFIFAVDNWERACQQLEFDKKMGWFPELEIFHQNCEDFNAKRYSGILDCLHASPPCPNWSNARHGCANEKTKYDGWKSTFRIFQEIRPKYLFLECVPGFQREHERIRKDLHSQGYQYKAIVFDAASLGIPHIRRRYWGLGYSNNDGKSVLQINAKTSILSPPHSYFWENDPRSIRIFNGNTDRVNRYIGIGNGQIPLATAFAARILGMPFI